MNQESLLSHPRMGGLIFTTMDKESNQIQPTELNRQQRLEVEKKAIDALLQMGVKFTVPLKIYPVKPPRFIHWWNKKFPKKARIWRDKRIPKGWDVTEADVPNVEKTTMEHIYQRNFYIKPLYLGTIDYLRKLYIQIEYDEEAIQDQPIQESKKLFKYIPLMAEIAAVAVINDPSVIKPNSEVKTLQKFFIEHLTVTRLKRLADVISQMMNPGGFTSSIRSIVEMGTTKPKENRADLIE